MKKLPKLYQYIEHDKLGVGQVLETSRTHTHKGVVDRAIIRLQDGTEVGLLWKTSGPFCRLVKAPKSGWKSIPGLSRR